MSKKQLKYLANQLQVDLHNKTPKKSAAGTTTAAEVTKELRSLQQLVPAPPTDLDLTRPTWAEMCGL